MFGDSSILYKMDNAITIGYVDEIVCSNDSDWSRFDKVSRQGSSWLLYSLAEKWGRFEIEVPRFRVHKVDGGFSDGRVEFGTSRIPFEEKV